jgi:hypothetical protein
MAAWALPLQTALSCSDVLAAVRSLAFGKFLRVSFSSTVPEKTASFTPGE